MPYAPKQHGSKRRKKRGNQQSKQRQKNRFYATNSRAWSVIRLDQLSNHPLCKHCESSGLVVAATDVDHKNGDKTLR